MHKPDLVARAFLIESEVDLNVAKLTFKNQIYSRTIFFSQQSMEKMVKGCLAAKSIFTTDHRISSLFAAVYGSELGDVDEIVEAIDSLEQYGARARFPLYRRSDLPIWIPSKEYNQSHAEVALKKAEFIHHTLKPHLEQVVQAPSPTP